MDKVYIITREHQVYDSDKDLGEYPGQGWEHILKDEIPLAFKDLGSARSQLGSLVSRCKAEDGGFSDNEVEMNDEGTTCFICTPANIWAFTITEVLLGQTADDLYAHAWDSTNKRWLGSRADRFTQDHRVNINRGW